MRPFDLFFSTLNMDRRTDQQAYIPKKMQFYISAMFLGFLDEIHKEKPSFLDFENNWLRTTDGRTDRRTDRPSYRDARTHLKKKRKFCSLKVATQIEVNQLVEKGKRQIKKPIVFILFLLWNIREQC